MPATTEPNHPCKSRREVLERLQLLISNKHPESLCLWQAASVIFAQLQILFGFYRNPGRPAQTPRYELDLFGQGYLEEVGRNPYDAFDRQPPKSKQEPCASLAELQGTLAALIDKGKPDGAILRQALEVIHGSEEQIKGYCFRLRRDYSPTEPTTPARPLNA